MSIAYITHPAFLRHDMGRHHPECPQRLTAIDKALGEAGLNDRLARYEAPPATDAQLERAHDPSYVEAIRSVAPRSGTVQLDADTSMNPHSLEAALRAAGAGILGVDLVMGGEAEAAFCAVRPPGHHAMRGRPM